MLFVDRRGCAICNGNGQSLLELLWLLKMNAFFLFIISAVTIVSEQSDFR